ncbi:MAG: hypothetical protein EOP10_17995 [Proteobacteria bacterium]|nr:MAG: hypothetical protein EOP10_17995 [Pseudomonadota bacterium]
MDDTIPIKTVKQRSPNGVNSTKPIPTRFKDDENAVIDEIAAQEQRSRASVVRLAALRGLAEYKKDRSALTPPFEI